MTLIKSSAMVAEFNKSPVHGMRRMQNENQKVLTELIFGEKNLGPLAQLVEQLTLNQQAHGSSP